MTTIVVALWTVLLIVLAFKTSSVLGALTLLIIGPLVFLLTMIYARVGLELMIVLFRISENVQEINQRGGGTQPATPGAPPEAGMSPAVAPA